MPDPQKQTGFGHGSDGDRGDRSCDAFEREWTGGKRPQIEDYLGESIEPERSKLLRELLTVEVECRRRFQEKPTPAEYESRFPEQSEVITDVFSKTVSWSPAEARFDPYAATVSPVSGSGNVPGVGERFGDYEILEKIGHGGMGVVYKARQLSADRTVALKLILQSSFVEPDRQQAAIQRFRTEAKSAARLDHDHVVTVYDVGEIGGHPYYSMKFVEGQSLREVRQEGPVDLGRVASYMEGTARGIHAAHQRGILHRDLKPENILVDRQTDRALVADFGLAKILEDQAEASIAGQLLGTPAYMSPEQARDSSNVTVASDVYGIGATLYYLLTGRPPIEPDPKNPVVTLRRVLNDDPIPPSRLNSTVDRDLETICLKCLEKEPAARYGSGAEVADELRRYRIGEPLVARPASRAERLWKWCRREPLVASLTAVSILLLLTVTIGSAVAAFKISHERDLATSRAEAEAAARVAERIARQEADQNALLAAHRHIQTLDALSTLVYEVQSQLKDRPSMQHFKAHLLDYAIAMLNPMTEAAETLTKADVTLAGAHRRMGDLFLEMGHPEKGLAQFQRCHEIVEELHQQGALQNVEQNMATSLNNLGEAALRLNDVEAAREYFLEALDQRETWLENNKEDARLAFWIPVEHITDSHHRLGRLALKVGDPVTALDYYQKVRKARDGWVRAYPNASRAQFQLAGIQSDLGDVYRQLGEFDEGLACLRDALPVFEKHAEGSEDILSSRWNVAITLDRMADLMLYTKEFRTARDCYQRACETLEQISKEDPLNARAKRDLALAYTGLGNASRELGEASAGDSYEKAFDLCMDLQKESPEDPRARAELMYASARTGRVTEAAELADALNSEFLEDPRMLMHVACGYSLCISRLAETKPEEQRTESERELLKEWEDKAIAAFQASIKCGWKDWVSLTHDPDFDAIRGREEFRRLLVELKEAAKANGPDP